MYYISWFNNVYKRVYFETLCPTSAPQPSLPPLQGWNHCYFVPEICMCVQSNTNIYSFLYPLTRKNKTSIFVLQYTNLLLYFANINSSVLLMHIHVSAPCFFHSIAWI